MEDLNELMEAKVAADEVIARIDYAIASLSSASSWGMFDIFGGGRFVSFLKREKIKNSNENIREISESLVALNKELGDVGMELPAGISDTMGDNIFDTWLDNIFTDMRVQGEMKESLNRLKEFRIAVVNLRERLKFKIERRS